MTTENTPTTKPFAKFSADRLKWVYAAKADFLDPRPHLQNILIEPCPSGGVYIVAANGALMMIAYDADGIASHRFTFNPLPGVAEACGYPFEANPTVSLDKDFLMDTITIDGDTLSAYQKGLLFKGRVPAIMQKINVGTEYPDWKPLAKPSGPTHPALAFVQPIFLEMAVFGVREEPAEISLHRYKPNGADPETQPLHITFTNLPLRGLLMPLKVAGGEAAAAPMPMPFDA